jgi:hypothetical protein
MHVRLFYNPFRLLNYFAVLGLNSPVGCTCYLSDCYLFHEVALNLSLYVVLVRFCCFDSYLRDTVRRRKYLFALTVSEVSVQGQLDPLFWTWDKAEYRHSDSMCQILLISRWPRNRGRKKEGARDQIHFTDPPTHPVT